MTEELENINILGNIFCIIKCNNKISHSQKLYKSKNYILINIFEFYS